MRWKAWALSTVLGGLALGGVLLVSGGPLGDPLEEGARCLDSGERGRGREAYERAFVLAEQTGDHEKEFAALIGLGDSDPPQSEGKQALDAFRRARELAVGREADVVEAPVRPRGPCRRPGGSGPVGRGFPECARGGATVRGEADGGEVP